MREQALQYIKDTYGADPEYLWEDGENAAIRHPRTQKWFAVLIQNLPKSKFGLDSDKRVDVLNLKCDPLMTHAVTAGGGCFPAYHMNKEHWISVLLDGTVPMEDLMFLIDLSFSLVDRYPKQKKKPSQP